MKRYFALILCVYFMCMPVRALSEEKLVALTFDDGPSGKYTRRLLDGLEERGAKSTFLLCGYRMAQYPQLTQRIFEDGHEIGLHGYTHKSMATMCPGEVLQEFERTLSLVPEGCPVTFLRAPGGLCGKYVSGAGEKLGLSVLSWSVDPRDWAVHDAKAVEKEVVCHVRDGDVILLHDMTDSSVDAALMIIDQLQAKGFRFVTASALAKDRNTPLLPGKKYTCFP